WTDVLLELDDRIRKETATTATTVTSKVVVVLSFWRRSYKKFDVVPRDSLPKTEWTFGVFLVVIVDVVIVEVSKMKWIFGKNFS
ncbi:7953_t:CDS:2, partial [Cetraspora pellucida]